MAAAALQEKVVSASTTVLSTGGLHVGQWFFPDWKAGGHGITNVTKALAESVNTYFYMVGGGFEKMKGLGALKLIDYFKKFGLSTPTGIDLPGERKGFVPTPDWKLETQKQPWYVGDTYHIAIGQGDILVTPLQVNAYTNYFANSGTSYVPHLVKSLIDPTTGETKDFVPQVLKQNLVGADVVNVVRQGLRQSVTSGSSRSLGTLPVPVANKTGTAQWSPDPKQPPHAWVTGWAPYDHPTLSYTVLIEEGQEGSPTAIAVAKDILAWYFGPKTPPTSTVIKAPK